MKTSNRLLMLSVLSALSGMAAAADNAPAAAQPAADTSEWKCESCKFEQGTTGSINLGAGYVSDRSAKFGEYNGLNRKGGFFIGDGDARYRGPDGRYWNLNATNLGLDTRSIDAEGGVQGKYKLLLKYDQIPHNLYDNAQTPYSGIGGANLTLPAGYPVATTAGLVNLPQTEIGTQRKRLGVGGAWIPVSGWEYAVNFRHETKDGTKRGAGAFFVNAANLPEPVDYETDQLDASASYTGGKWQAKLAYYGSIFHSGNGALNFQNPFIGPVAPPVATSGQLALPPDNQFHQFLASAGYQVNSYTRATADIAAGRMTQNDNFLPSSTTAGLVGLGPVPSTSLGGHADTLNANVKLTSAVTSKIRLNASYGYNDRANHTPQSSYPSVATDMFVEAPRTNLPYSFLQEKIKLSGEYKFTGKTRASVGYDNDQQKRTYQETNKTHEDTGWAKFTAGIGEKMDLSLKYAHGDRRNTGYLPVPGIVPIENPLMRKYNMANRVRDTGGLRFDIAARENLNIGFGADSSKDTYSESSIGLTNASSLNFNGDVTWAFTPQTSMHVFANRETIKSKQAGSQSFSTVDWTGENKDTIDFFGFGVKHLAMKDKLDLGADYGWSHSEGEVNMVTSSANPGFPKQTTALDSLKLYATYRVKENVSINASYWYEHYSSNNWAYDNVAPGTIPNFLAFGTPMPKYSVNVFRLSMRYKF